MLELYDFLLLIMGSRLYVFRHTQSIDNLNFIFSGGRNVGLSKEGIKEAKKLSYKLRSAEIDIAFNSDLLRSIETMDIVLENHPGVIRCIDRRIRERSYGLLEGHSKKWMAKFMYPIFKIYHRSYLIPPPKGESLKMVQSRVKLFVDELVKYLNGKSINVAICAHSGSIRGIRQYFEKFPDSEFGKIETNVGELFEYVLN